MKENLQEFQVKKQAAEKKVKIGAPIAILGGVLAFLLSSVMFIGIIIAIGGLIYAAIGGSEFSKLSHQFKKQVLVDLVASFVDDGRFDPDSGLNIGKVYATEFVRHADRWHTEDYLSGSMSGVQFESSDVKLEERHVEHTKNGTRTYYETYFLGRIFVFDFNKSFDGYLQVLEHGRPTVKRGYNKVKLESVQFNKKFKTYATSDHSAFYVLTPHFMEALMDFEKNNKGSIKFSFIDNLLYIGIHNNRDTFELRMFRPLDEETFKEFERDLLVIKEVIDELRLNNRIFK